MPSNLFIYFTVLTLTLIRQKQNELKLLSPWHKQDQAVPVVRVFLCCRVLPAEYLSCLRMSLMKQRKALVWWSLDLQEHVFLIFCVIKWKARCLLNTSAAQRSSMVVPRRAVCYCLSYGLAGFFRLGYLAEPLKNEWSEWSVTNTSRTFTDRVHCNDKTCNFKWKLELWNSYLLLNPKQLLSSNTVLMRLMAVFSNVIAFVVYLTVNTGKLSIAQWINIFQWSIHDGQNPYMGKIHLKWEINQRV